MIHLKRAVEYLEDLEELYMDSSCHAMTIVLHHKYNYPIFVLRDTERSFRLADGTLAPIHSFVKVSNNVALDVRGRRSFEDITKEFGSKNPVFESVTEEYLINLAGIFEEDLEMAKEDMETLEL